MRSFLIHTAAMSNMPVGRPSEHNHAERPSDRMATIVAARQETHPREPSHLIAATLTLLRGRGKLKRRALAAAPRGRVLARSPRSSRLSPVSPSKLGDRVGPRARTSDLVYAEHFQPVGMFLGLVPNQVEGFDPPLRLFAIGEIDEARALGAEHVQA